MMHPSRHPLSPRDRSARHPRIPRLLTDRAPNSACCEPLEPRLFLAADPLLAPLPQSILAHLGRSDAAVISDLDGDGWNEVLVGNAGIYTAGRSAGYTFGAYVLSGRDGSILREHEVGGATSTDPSGSFGQSVAAIGDITGDGVIDYAIGRPNRDQGYVHVFSGASGEELASLTHNPFSIYGLGWSLLGLGDVTGDDVPDFAAGAPAWNYRPPGTTLVYIYSGADFSVHATASSYGAQIGEFLALAGDVDGDGANDFLTGQNRVYSGATGQLLLQMDLAGAGVIDAISAIAMVADLNNDGHADFAAVSSQQERIIFFSGADGAFLRDIAVTGFPFGGLQTLGDRTGDGLDELAVGIQGRVEVYSTADGSLLQTIDPGDLRLTTPGGAVGNGTYATKLASGDVNADGRTDLLVLTHMLGGYLIATGPGRTDLFLGQDAPNILGPDLLDSGSELTIASDDGLVVAGVNSRGDLIAFTRATADGPWQMHTLAGNAGVLTLDVFDDPRTGRLTIVASTFDAMRLFAFVPGSGQWAETEIDDSQGQITRLLRAFTFADGRIGLVGMGVSGSLGLEEGIMLYEQSGSGWQFTNVTLDLAAHGQIQPTFDEFTVYVAPWNAVHITGRGPAGVSTVWRSHLTPSWVYTPIGQQVPEAQQLTSLSAFVAPWGGLHVAGVTPDGHVGVLWWSFELLETGWEYTDLTATQNGPLFKQAPITTYVTDWGGLNIVGVDVDGDLSAYWWVPGFGADWVTEAIALDPGSATLVDPIAVLDSIFEPRHNGMRITAASADGDVIIYTWRPAQGATWLFENLSATVA